jgi:hypothetical protein
MNAQCRHAHQPPDRQKRAVIRRTTTVPFSLLSKDPIREARRFASQLIDDIVLVRRSPKIRNYVRIVKNSCFHRSFDWVMLRLVTSQAPNLPALRLTPKDSPQSPWKTPPITLSSNEPVSLGRQPTTHCLMISYPWLPCRGGCATLAMATTPERQRRQGHNNYGKDRKDR